VYKIYILKKELDCIRLFYSKFNLWFSISNIKTAIFSSLMMWNVLDIYTAVSEKHAPKTTLMMEAAGSYKLSVHVHHSTQHDVPIDSYLHFIIPYNLSQKLRYILTIH